MNDDVERALDDVSEIKRVLAFTVDDFSSVANLFIVTGSFWVVKGILSIWNMFGSINIIVAIISRSISFIGFIATLCIYLSCRKEQKRRAKGLGLQLIDMWGCLFLGVTVYARIADMTLLLSADNIPQHTSFYSIFLMVAIPLMLMVTGILVDRKSPKILSVVYIISNLIFLAFPIPIEYSIGQDITLYFSFGVVLGTDIFPGLFTLFLGIIQYKTGTRV